MAAELQTIPARHGVATFVPAGHVIKIINTSGTQVVDTWAFALPKPEAKGDDQEQREEVQKVTENTNANEEKNSPSEQKKTKKQRVNFPDQDEAERLTKEELAKSEKDGGGTKQKSPWSSYVPSIGKWTSKSETKLSTQGDQAVDGETEQQRDSRTWASYFPSGKAITSYIPQQASDNVSSFAASHSRDQSKPYLTQLRDFSRTPVGAAGLAALTGSGYTSSLYAGYQAYDLRHAPRVAPMEFLSLAHTRVANLRLCPGVSDVLVTNLRAPILTFLEDASGCRAHDALIPACDPGRYGDLGVEGWEGHGSCAENLVLALGEIDEAAGLKGERGVGAGVVVGDVPGPWNLFMNVGWDREGRLSMGGPEGGKGGFVRLRAERDVVVVMSACPQDVVKISGEELADAHFVVEGEGEDVGGKLRKAKVSERGKGAGEARRERPPPRKLSSSAPGARKNGAAGASATARKKSVPHQVKPKAETRASTGGKQAATDAESTSKTVTRPMKKPIPPTDIKQSTDGDAPAPVERKKPRKLATRSKSGNTA